MDESKNAISKLGLDKLGPKNSLLVFIAVLAVIVTGVLILNNGGTSTEITTKNAIDYLNTKILQNGQTATLLRSSKESGLIKMTMKIGEQDYDMYATKDGKLLFLQGIPLKSE